MDYFLRFNFFRLFFSTLVCYRCWEMKMRVWERWKRKGIAGNRKTNFGRRNRRRRLVKCIDEATNRHGNSESLKAGSILKSLEDVNSKVVERRNRKSNAIPFKSHTLSFFLSMKNCFDFSDQNTFGKSLLEIEITAHVVGISHLLQHSHFTRTRNRIHILLQSPKFIKIYHC